MIGVYTIHDAVELLLVECALEAEGIPYFVHNRGFGGLHPGPLIGCYNDRTIMVPPSAAEAAAQVIAELFPADGAGTAASAEPVESWGYKLRLVVETILFAWFVPERRPGTPVS